jgi:hypothetical protein
LNSPPRLGSKIKLEVFLSSLSFGVHVFKKMCEFDLFFTGGSAWFQTFVGSLYQALNPKMKF